MIGGVGDGAADLANGGGVSIERSVCDIHDPADKTIIGIADGEGIGGMGD